MRKSIEIGILLALALWGFSSCGKSSNKVATGPSTYCLQYANCGHNAVLPPNWQPYQVNQSGLYVGQVGGYANGFCGCSPGFVPAYHGAHGLACVPSVQVQAGISYQTYGFNQNSWDWQNLAPTPYEPVVTNGCTQRVLYACDNRDNDPCGSNGYCRLSGGGGHMGTCVYN